MLIYEMNRIIYLSCYEYWFLQLIKLNAVFWCYLFSIFLLKGNNFFLHRARHYIMQFNATFAYELSSETYLRRYNCFLQFIFEYVIEPCSKLTWFCSSNKNGVIRWIHCNCGFSIFYICQINLLLCMKNLKFAACEYYQL